MNYSKFRRKNRKNKYHAVKITFNDETFDSKRELGRYTELLKLQDKGIIKDLARQVKYVLIPTQREPGTIGPRGGIRQGKLLENECSYVADFVYQIVETGQIVVEDTKGVRTKDYIIKRKLMLFVYGIQIKEI